MGYCGIRFLLSGLGFVQGLPINAKAKSEPPITAGSSCFSGTAVSRVRSQTERTNNPPKISPMTNDKNGRLDFAVPILCLSWKIMGNAPSNAYINHKRMTCKE
jgi:hypothetical protein